jgi:hypothetical protein
MRTALIVAALAVPLAALADEVRNLSSVQMPCTGCSHCKGLHPAPTPAPTPPPDEHPLWP